MALVGCRGQIAAIRTIGTTRDTVPSPPDPSFPELVQGKNYKGRIGDAQGAWRTEGKTRHIAKSLSSEFAGWRLETTRWQSASLGPYNACPFGGNT